MELLRTVSNTQFLYPAAAVALVLICAALVFMFGFHSAEQPQFDKLPLVLEDKKSSSKKKKTKDKKSSPNRNATEDTKTKSEPKKSPAKEKKEEKAAEKPKPKERPEENKPKRETVVEVKKSKKTKTADIQKPVDFDEGEWEEVPKKSDKKKVKGSEEKKESPVKKNKKKAKESDVEAARAAPEPEVEAIVVTTEGPIVDEEAQKALEAQVQELQRVLKEAERREQAALGSSVEEDEDPAIEEIPEVKDLRSNKKNQNKEKQKKQKANEVAAAAKNSAKIEAERESDSSDKQEEKPNAPVFDELGDTWTEAKVPKKSKKKARKE